MPIVLVQNPVIVNRGYEWKDILGEQYHFPNQYKNRCMPGTPFVYYRGTRRPDGKRAMPEYFGHGMIGDVWRDKTIPESAPKKDWAWYCRIEDYTPFPTRVPAKANGQFLERIARNHWSVGVRPLPQDVYETILQFAGTRVTGTEVAVSAPDIASVTITESQASLLIPRKPSAAKEGSGSAGRRYSKKSGPVGTRAEEIAYRYLVEHAPMLGARNIRGSHGTELRPDGILNTKTKTDRRSRLKSKEARRLFSGTSRSPWANGTRRSH